MRRPAPARLFGLILLCGTAFAPLALAGDRIGSIEIKGRPHNQPPATPFGAQYRPLTFRLGM